MTVKELVNFVTTCKHIKKGYCCEQDADTPKHLLKVIGYNSGVYGWNWTCYYEPSTDTAYISYYRNVPDYIKER